MAHASDRDTGRPAGLIAQHQESGELPGTDAEAAVLAAEVVARKAALDVAAESLAAAEARASACAAEPVATSPAVPVPIELSALLADTAAAALALTETSAIAEVLVVSALAAACLPAAAEVAVAIPKRSWAGLTNAAAPVPAAPVSVPPFRYRSASSAVDVAVTAIAARRVVTVVRDVREDRAGDASETIGRALMAVTQQLTRIADALEGPPA